MINLLVAEIGQEIVAKLMDSTINTSWYQRKQTADEKVSCIPNPANIQMEQVYEHNQKLLCKYESELKEWKDFAEKESSVNTFDFCLNEKDTHFLQELEREAQNRTDALASMDSWFKGFPFKVEQLKTNLSTCFQFEKMSKDFCERVFQQIFSQFYSNRTKSKVEPMLLLRAISRTAE